MEKYRFNWEHIHIAPGNENQLHHLDNELNTKTKAYY